MPSKVVLSTSFKHCIKRYKKRYPHVKDDVKTAIFHLLQSPDAGALIPGGNGARKFRVRNSDIRKGKSGGYRLIYYRNSHAGETLYLLLLYAKSDKTDVSIAELKTLLKEVSQ